MKNNQIKSKDRVKERGEVFTAEREVKAMCDLIPKEQWTIQMTFLEPSCGTGNFLVEILQRKLDLCKSLDDIKIAINSIFGVDIMPDNIIETRTRLFNLCLQKIQLLNVEFNLLDSFEILDILSKNIIGGNFLTKLDFNNRPIWFLNEN